MDSSELKKQKYDQTFEATLNHLEMRRLKDPSFTLDELEELIETEYINMGNDWSGRGSLYHVTQKAKLAAYEIFHSEWKQEESN